MSASDTKEGREFLASFCHAEIVPDANTAVLIKTSLRGKIAFGVD
jgi:hypothetical protein